MKMRFRSHCERLNSRTSMHQNTPVSFSHCPCCNAEAPETTRHFLLFCPAYGLERVKMFNRTTSILEKYEDNDATVIHSQDFRGGSDERKLQILLGEQSGLLRVDKSIDRACKKFMRAATKIRDSAIIATN